MSFLTFSYSRDLTKKELIFLVRITYLEGTSLMLLRNRSRAVTKPTLMADHNNQNCARNIPSLFGSPKFRDFTNNNSFSATEALKSPTSILDTRMLSPYAFGKPFSYDNKRIQTTAPNKTSSSETRSSWEKSDYSKGIGLALVNVLKDDDEPINENSVEQPNKGNVLFGTQLRVKIPPLQLHPCAYDFGTTKTKDSSNSETSPSEVVVTATGTGILSLSEMELSEEYTCVINHGPNPKTTHIFNNCIVESYFSSLPQTSDSGNFLSVCYTCKKHLDQTKDIFIYRGEKAFCSCECRHREMVLDDVESFES